MAKPAKSRAVELSARVVNSIMNKMHDCESDLQSAKGRYMAQAKRIRETRRAVLEGAAAQSIRPKIVKLQFQIEVTTAKLRALIADLDIEERKQAKDIAKARGDKRQMSLFTDLPQAAKPEKPTSEPNATLESSDEVTVALQ